MGSLVGRTLAGYAITSTLGKGGMGVVYRARQESLGREVALKVISDEAKKHQGAVKRFHREVRIHLELSHPHLAQVYDAGVEGDHAYIAMELIDGPPLGEILARGGPMPVSEVTRLADGLLDALHYLHERGVLHRDIKPANILVGSNGEAKIVDLGLARQEHGTLLTTDQEFFGTVLYSPPEIFTGSDHSPAGDVYAMGLVLLEMLVGEPNFPKRTIQETIEAILTEPIKPPRHHGREDVPDALADLLMEIVSMEAERRPSAGRALMRLRALAPPPASRIAPASVPRRTEPRTPAPSSPPPKPTGLRRTTTVLRSWIPMPAGQGALAAGFAASLVTGLWLGLQPAPHGRPGIPVLSPAPSAPARDPSTVPWMREQLANCEELILRYDRESPDPEKHHDQSIIRTSLLGDDFFRQRVGDTTLIFTALSRFLDVLSRGDEEHIDHPVWIDAERVGYDILMEAARSNGFDTGSPLEAPLRRLERALSEQRDGRHRRMVPLAILPVSNFFKGLADREILSRVSAHEQLLEEMDELPAEWKSSSRAIVLRLVVLNRLGDVWVAAGRNATPDRAREIEAGTMAARLATLDLLRAVPPRMAVDPDLETPWLWNRFQAVTTALPMVESGSDRLQDSLRMLGDMTPRLDFFSLSPTRRIALRRCLAIAALESASRPEVVLEPALLEQYRRLQGAFPMK